MTHRRIVARLLAWFGQNARDLPWRRTRDPYGVWVSEVMLQQTQVKAVIPYWERWMEELPTIEALAKTKRQRIHKLWEGLGYYTRVRNMQQAARLILKRHGGNFPRQYEEVLELPGVGRYTAGAICSIAFDQARPVLDGNVTRVLSRAFGIEGNVAKAETKAKLWALAEELVQEAVGFRQPGLIVHPESAQQDSQSQQLSGRFPAWVVQRPASSFNQALMELGALVCTARAARCGVCPLAKACVAFRDGRVEELPRAARRAKATVRRFAAFVVQNGNRFLVRQRPQGVVNAYLWEFPNIELANGNSDLKRAARIALGFQPPALVALGSVKHSITRYRITMGVFRVETETRLRTNGTGARWLPLGMLKTLPFASAHKVVLGRVSSH